MNTIIKSFLTLVCGVCLLASCDDDLSNNPTLQEPATFKLNTPSYAAQEIDLARSSQVTMTWSQPDYGFPAAAEYRLQFSLNDKYVVSTSEALNDPTGKLKADYETFDAVFKECKAEVDAGKLAAVLQRLAQYEEGQVPDVQKVYARAVATLNGQTIYSNSVAFQVNPYYVELKDALPVVWYMVGGCIGNGTWSNDQGSIGAGLIPMFVKAGEAYDKVTGKGVVEYTTYFPAGGEFKIVRTPGNWDYGICAGFVLRNGGDDPGNIVVGAEGIYTVTLDTKSETCSMVKYNGVPAIFASMKLVGDAVDGGSIEMTPVETYAGAQNHIWRADVTINNGGVKFVSGDTQWGADSFPYAVSTTTGNDIAVKAGSYLVLFNDITGAFQFYQK